MEERLPLHAELPSGVRPGRWLDYHVYPSEEGVSVFFRDVTDVVAAREALASVSRQLLASQEEERQRIASELHDSTAQHLVAASLGLMGLAAATGEDAMRRREEIAVSLGEALKELRIFTYLVHPPGLQKDGLRSTLEHFVAGFAHRADLKATVRASARIDDLSHDLQRSVFRVVQEALSNAHRHGSATRIGVNAKLARGVLFVRISDNGRGMSTSQTGSPAPNGHGMGVGIPGMRARMQQFGGDLQIRSHPGRTTVLAIVPLTPRRGEPNRTGHPPELFPEFGETA